MRVFHIRSSSGFYGAESVITNLLPVMSRKGADNHLLIIENYINGNTTLYKRTCEQGISSEIVPCARRIDLATYRALLARMQNIDDLIIHAHDYKSLFYAILIKARLKAKVVITLHGWITNSWRQKFYKSVEILLLGFADKVIVVSESISVALANRIALKCVYISNGVDTEKYSPNNRTICKSDLGIPEDTFLLGNVSRFTQEKNHHMMLKAINLFVRKGIQDVNLVLVGDGPLESEIKNQCRKLNVLEQVHFLGTRCDVNSIMPMFDCYLSTSYTEGMPMSVLEAMSCGCPLISTPVGAIPSLIEQSCCGELVAIDDVSELTRKIELYRENPARSHLMGMRGRSFVESFSTLKAQAKRHIALYKALVEP